MLAADRTLAFSWSTPAVEEAVRSLEGLAVQQGRVAGIDPALRLSDGSWLELFSGDPLEPWFVRLPGGVFTGEPTAPVDNG
ncbi:hypothetical protein ACPCG0_12440 [Propionibacteriaceae bacterium Y1923]|uniref:hypothetical protein n=1 Tax=Aestuariimicrobium sp. Y1814 TaxID=3418742 RepID=UPI003C18DD46